MRLYPVIDLGSTEYEFDVRFEPATSQECGYVEPYATVQVTGPNNHADVVTYETALLDWRLACGYGCSYEEAEAKLNEILLAECERMYKEYY